MKKARRWRALLAGFCGDTSPRGFRIALGEEQCKENRRGERYEGHDEREAGREKQEAAGAGARVGFEPKQRGPSAPLRISPAGSDARKAAQVRSSTPASKDGSPGTPACECASQGGRVAQDRTKSHWSFPAECRPATVAMASPVTLHPAPWSYTLVGNSRRVH
jgi:hypothetical protein